MKISKTIRLLSLVLVLSIVLPFTSAFAADTISSGGRFIPAYSAKDTSTRLPQDVPVSNFVAENESGWYKVPGYSGGQMVYVRASDLTSINGATASPSPEPTQVPVTLPPGVTASPTPAPTAYIEGEKDPTYSGTVLSYTVPTSGLFLYSTYTGTGNPVETLKSGTKISLTSPVYDERNQAVSGWYSLYYSGKTYYVPESQIVFSSDPAAATPVPSTIASAIVKGGEDYYFAYIKATSTTESSVDTSQKAGTTAADVRMNVKYVDKNVYSFNDGGTTYYIRSNAIMTGTESTASVVGNDDVTLVTQIRLPTKYMADPTVGQTIKLYMSPKTSSNYYTLPDDSNKNVETTYLSAVKEDDTWYKVTYNGSYYYVLIADVTAMGSASQVANNDSTVATATFWITIGSQGAGYYLTTAAKASNQKVGDILAGTNVLVSQVDSTWYGYTVGTKIYYIHKEDVATSSSSSQMSSYRVLLEATTALYDSKSATKASSTTLPMEAGATSAYFTVNSVDATWFSIVVNGTTYYIKKASLASDTVLEPIASTTTGKTYNVTIGATTAVLYIDAALTQKSGHTYDPGSIVSATKYTSTLYKVNISGSYYFLPASYVVSVSGGDDKAANDPDNPSSGSVSEIIQGETNDSFDRPVLTYLIPTGGLWLYKQENLTSRAVALEAGKSIQLTQSSTNSSWYTTWYGGSQYYVPESQMKATTVNTSGTYSILLKQDVTLYSTAKTESVKVNNITVKETVLSSATGAKLQAGTRANVKIHSYVDGNSANSVSTYSTTYSGKTVYFYAFNPGSPGDAYVDFNSYLTATTADNTSTSLITKLFVPGVPVTDPPTAPNTVALYTYPSTSNSSIDVTGPATLYGISYDKDWYQVIHNNGSWYLNKAEFNAITGSTTEQISIAGGVTANTYTVVIGSKGASLYRTASTATTNNNLHPTTLTAGQTVRATKYNSTWYSMLIDASGETVYFQNNVVANSNADDAVRSFVITTTTELNLYSTISANGNPMGMKLPADTYTMRTVDGVWSSVFYEGFTYYVKTADINADDLGESTPIASTSVGKTYTITLGNDPNMMVYNSMNLPTGGTSRGPLPGGYTTKGTKLVNDNGVMVFQITYNGITGYINAKYVVGVLSGDEVDEAKEAENEGGSTAIGDTVYVSVNSGTAIYKEMNTSGTPHYLPSTMTVALKKVSAGWYSLEFLGATYYMPASAVEGTGGSSNNGGANIAVGDSFQHTFSKEVPAYTTADSDSAIAATLMPNQEMQLKKISDLWYECTLPNGQRVYITANDVWGNNAGSSGGTSGTTDGTGIITATIKINPASGTVNLRKTASVSSTVLDRIPKGTVLLNGGYEVDKNGQVWYKVAYEGRNGYVIGTYVEAVGTGGGGTGTSTDPTQDIGRSLTVDVSSVNIRSGAGTNFGIIGKLERNAVVVPKSYSTGTDGMVWYSFQFTSTQVGYIRYDYLAGGIASTTELTGNVAIKAGGTNLRSGAGAGFTVKAKLPRDLIVTIIGSGTDSENVLWYRITVENLDGYVRSDLVRTLTLEETGSLQNSVVGSYTELKYGDSGTAVLAMQNQLINIGYMAAGSADGTYGTATTAAVKAFQTAKGLSATGVASAATQAAIFNTSVISSGSTASLDWFSTGYTLINSNPNIQVYDINAAVTWNAKYINGANHADVVPASTADAQKLRANNITGSYVRRPVIVTIAGQKFAGSMYAVGHGSTNYVSYFSGVMCIHFTGSKTHGTGNVDADHQTAINEALNYANK